MRIAVLCSDLGVRVPGEKGASLHLCAIATALARAGNDVMLVGVAGHGEPPADVRALLLPHPGRSEGLRRELRKLRFVERLARHARAPLVEFQPDVVYERLSLFGTAGQRLAAAAGALHVIEVNALLAQEEAHWRGLRLGRLARRRQRATLTAAHLRVAVSREVAAQIQAIASGEPTVVIPNGVDALAFARLPPKADARRLLGLPPAPTLIGFAGSLRPWHGLETAVEALKALPEIVLAIAGDGPVRTDLEKLARRGRVGDRIRWLGRLPHDRIPTFLASLDVALLPYPELRDFGFSPLKLFEYLAAGVPVVASDVGQVHELLEAGRWGRLVPPGDAGALAGAVRGVLEEPDRGRALAAAARARTLELHSWDRRARQLGDLFRGYDRALAS